MSNSRVYRSDYTPSSYLIHTTELNFELSETEAIITSTVQYYRNPNANPAPESNPALPQDLYLDGNDLILLSIALDGKTPNYSLTATGLQIHSPPSEFVLKIQTKIHPNQNTHLSGLYQSGGNFCTQCEPHGFRYITYYLDRPDVLSVFTTRIQADRARYPVLLSNGNLRSRGTGEAIWHDPHPKPCYLFALVAGDLVALEDTFITSAQQTVALKIYTQAHNAHKTQFAMRALKRAMAWDQARFGLVYDLDIFMIVAVDDFNMGAMENKGLNIFNSACVLADPETATDDDFMRIESVIGHEYFHNWTGNRITCRDWFQLSLKEGLTVFRDQEFSGELHSQAIKRIEDVAQLRALQFAEDTGPMAHPVRGESYLEINNFYTYTVYEKGAELIRMLHTFLGEDDFQRGMQLYVQRHDGCAVTIDDFIAAMTDANDFDLTDFMPWYSKSGTPEVKLTTRYDAPAQTFRATFTQLGDCFYLPIRYGLLDENGAPLQQGVITLREAETTIEFKNLPTKPIGSWLRDFSAPIKLHLEITREERIFLLKFDTDALNRWDNAQSLWLDFILTPSKLNTSALFDAFNFILQTSTDDALTSKLLTLPATSLIQQQVEQINPQEMAAQIITAETSISKHLRPALLETYQRLHSDEAYRFNTIEVGKRALKHRCLYYLVQNSTDPADFERAYQQFTRANCMSDSLASFSLLINNDNPFTATVIQEFAQRYGHDTIAMDKWFAVQSRAKTTDARQIATLMSHPLFCFNTPNRLRAVLGSFSQNSAQFHTEQGYQLFTDALRKLNTSNPQLGARLLNTYNHWRRYIPALRSLQNQQLKQILALKPLSNDMLEIAQAAIASRDEN